MRLFWILLVFVMVGPPVGALIFMLAVAVVGMGMRVDLGGLTWVALFAVIYGIPFGYLIGIGPAAAAGLIVGIRQAFFGRLMWWAAFATGLVVGLGFQLATGQPITAATDQSVDTRQQAVIMIATCMGATFLCWAIVRRWYFDPSPSGAAS